nr:reverse transcriptase domain-containing protein [Tanacetum cinerariifolium]
MPTTRQGASKNMIPEAVRAIINQAMQRNSTNGDGSHSSGGGPTRPVQSVRACSYTDFMKCQPLNFRGTEGVVSLSRWYEKMESVFHISGCAIENQESGHYKCDCLELKNRNHRDQAEGTGARGMVYALGGGETNQDLDDI